MNRFTIFFDYCGGTYISQVRALNHNEAVRNWYLSPNQEMLKSLKYNNEKLDWANDLIEKIERDESCIVKVEGLISVWYISYIQDENLAGLGIVKTKE